MQALSLRTGLILALVVAAFAIIVGTAFAKQEGGARPGWGNGDENHEHTGPPGGTSVRPGNGFGDENHEHSGPPGQS
jgi:hypothetical protein